MESGYQAALDGAAFLHRKGRRFLEVTGKSPGEMLKGILSGTIPGPLTEVRGNQAEKDGSAADGPAEEGEAQEGEAARNAGAESGGETTSPLLAGWAHYSTALTPKGKMVTDLRVIPQVPEGFLLELSEAGFAGLETHFRKYLHPRFAGTRDRSGELSMISIVGPEGTKVVARALGMRGLGKGFGHPGLVQEPARGPGHPGGVQGPAKGMAPATGVQGLAKASGPGGGVHGSMGGIAMGKAPGSPVPQSSGDAVWRLTHPDLGTLFVLENRDLEDRELENRDEGRPASDPGHRGLPALDVIAKDQVLDALGKALEEAGASPMGPEAWEILRIEAGAPAFGLDMTEDTIPVEAGIHRRAVDYRKGCYTGQEVIVRIRDRGQVNKRLCRLLMGDIPLPEAGTALFSTHEDRSRGWITSACRSPRFGQTVALGYVKRGLEPGDEVRVGSPDGPPGRVEAL